MGWKCDKPLIVVLIIVWRAHLGWIQQTLSKVREYAILAWHEMCLLGIWPPDSETLLPLQRDVDPLHHRARNVVCFLTLNVRLWFWFARNYPLYYVSVVTGCWFIDLEHLVSFAREVLELMPEHYQAPEHWCLLNCLGCELLLAQILNFLLKSLYNLS